MAQRTGPSRRTQAERDAIDARAAAYPRPLSARQSELLRRIGAVVEFREGYSRQTAASLHVRGLIKSGKRGGSLRVTSKGREELKRHSPREGRHALGLRR